MLRLHQALAVALLVASPSWGEIVEVNGDDSPTTMQDNAGVACNTAGDCYTDVNDSSATTAVCDNDTGGGAILFSLATPSGNPSTGSNQQTVQGTASKHDDSNNGVDCSYVSGSGEPTISVEIYCNDVASGVSPVSGTTITGDNFSFSGTFTFGTTIGSATCAADGSDLQFQVTVASGGGGPNERWGAIEEIEWDAAVTGAGRARRTF